MKTRLLRDIEVSEVGMGCMAFSHGYGQIPPEEYSVEAIRNACRNGYWASLEDGCRYGRKLMGQEENGQYCWRKGEKGHEKNTCFKHGYAGGTFIYRVCWWK